MGESKLSLIHHKAMERLSLECGLPVETLEDKSIREIESDQGWKLAQEEEQKIAGRMRVKGSYYMQRFAWVTQEEKQELEDRVLPLLNVGTSPRKLGRWGINLPKPKRLRLTTYEGMFVSVEAKKTIERFLSRYVKDEMEPLYGLERQLKHYPTAKRDRLRDAVTYVPRRLGKRQT